MRKIIPCALCLFICISFKLSAQNKYTISGYVKDVKTGEELIGATLVIKELPATGANANAYGFYSITIPEGKYTLTAQFTGYQAKADTIILNKSIKHDFTLSDAPAQLGEVIVTDEKKDENVTQTQMGINKLDIQQLKAVPVFFWRERCFKNIAVITRCKICRRWQQRFLC